jgi:hypothetical protein
MRSALYYPHTELDSTELLKTGLLLWDQIRFIVPYPDYRPKYKTKLIAEAMDIIGDPHCPTDDEKKEAHEQIESFLANPLPQPFYYTNSKRKGFTDYEVYPQKLLNQTWELLREKELAGKPLANADFPFMEPTGLTIMAMLADCCAGETFQRVTDENAAYATLVGLLSSDGRSPMEKPQASHEQLVPITLEVINDDGIDLKRLIALRKREQQGGGHKISELRHRYLDRIDSYAKTLTTLKKRKQSDEEEIKRQFHDDMKDDFASLKDELRVARKEALLSKEVIISAVALAGTVAAAFAPFAVPGVYAALGGFGGSLATIGGIWQSKSKYASSRESILKKHPTAYLFQLRSPRASLL